VKCVSVIYLLYLITGNLKSKLKYADKTEIKGMAECISWI